jgi:hypothetical protein
MKLIFLVMMLANASCSSIPQCGQKSISIQLPSAVPFFGNEPFEIKRQNDHVSCGEDD